MLKNFFEKTFTKPTSLCSVRLKIIAAREFSIMEKPKSQDVVEKNDSLIDKSQEVKLKQNSVDDREEYKWKKSKKMACMLSFSGKDYMGMQNQRSQG